MNAPTPKDIAAAEMLLGTSIAISDEKIESVSWTEIRGGQPPEKWSVKGSSGNVYDVELRPDTVKGGTYLFCPCVGWGFQKGKGKDCKHVAQVRATEGTAR